MAGYNSFTDILKQNNKSDNNKEKFPIYTYFGQNNLPVEHTFFTKSFFHNLILPITKKLLSAAISNRKTFPPQRFRHVI